jgi:predicted cupin superfamily sugar epimerase
MHPEARALIDRLRLQPIPGEGGWFRETWRSPLTLAGGAVAGVDSDRPAGTAILALFCQDPRGFSALHRLPIDEVWHFYGGDPLHHVVLHDDGAAVHLNLGDDEVQTVVPAGRWMGGRVVDGGRYALIGCTMAPGFVDSDCELASRDELMARYPDEADEIIRLTR